jgi:hypothetical protein
VAQLYRGGAHAVKLEAPPPRQRVIERDGRLVVIDSGAVPRAEPRKAAGATFRQTAFDGRGILTTRRWYDDKGPRQLAVDPVTGKVARAAPAIAAIAVLALIALFIMLPYALAVVPLAVQPKPWRRMKAKVTGYLDKFSAPAG